MIKKTGPCGCPCDACTNYCEQCPPACTEGHTYTGGCQLMKPYGCDGCQCWIDTDDWGRPGVWYPNAHCPHHGVTPSRAAGSPGVGTDNSRRTLDEVKRDRDVTPAPGCQPSDCCGDPRAHIYEEECTECGVRQDFLGLCEDCAEASDGCPHSPCTDGCLAGHGCGSSLTLREAAKRAPELIRHPREPRSCDSIPADARWEVGCEPGRCVAGHQQLNTEEKDGGLFAALKRYGRWLDRWR